MLDPLLDSAETKMNVKDNTRMIIAQSDGAGPPEKLLGGGGVKGPCVHSFCRLGESSLPVLPLPPRPLGFPAKAGLKQVSPASHRML